MRHLVLIFRKEFNFVGIDVKKGQRQIWKTGEYLHKNNYGCKFKGCLLLPAGGGERRGHDESCTLFIDPEGSITFCCEKKQSTPRVGESAALACWSMAGMLIGLVCYRHLIAIDPFCCTINCKSSLNHELRTHYTCWSPKLKLHSSVGFASVFNTLPLWRMEVSDGLAQCVGLYRCRRRLDGMKVKADNFQLIALIKMSTLWVLLSNSIQRR